jgi:hypothetical protein
MRKVLGITVSLAALCLGLTTALSAGAHAAATDPARPSPEVLLPAVASSAIDPMNVAVLRGSAAPARQVTGHIDTSRVAVVGGRRVWLVDRVTRQVRSCAVRKTSTVGVREVRCTAGSASGYRRGFGATFKP